MPVPVFSALFRVFSRFFPAIGPAATILFQPPANGGYWSVDAAALAHWQHWRSAFLQQPGLPALGTPATAEGLIDFAWLMQDSAVIAALDAVLAAAPQPAWQKIRAKREKPPARLLICGPQQQRWADEIRPLARQLPEALAIFVLAPEVSIQSPPTPPSQPWENPEQTRAYLCRGLACSSAITDLAYLLDTLQDG